MTAPTVTKVRPSALRRFTIAHPIGAFLLIAFSIAYPLMSLVALAVHGLIRVPACSNGSPGHRTRSPACCSR